MTDDLLDPGEPGEASTSLKAKDLTGHPCIFVPREMGMWEARAEEKDDKGNVTQEASNESPYVECSVWKLDRAGVVEQGDGVRVSWYRVVPQLEDKVGRYVAAMPTQDTATGNGKSIILTPLSEAMKAVAVKVVEDLKAAAATVEPGTEVF